MLKQKMLLKNIAQTLLELETFPVFDVAHNLLAATEVRKLININGKETWTNTHPFVSWLLTVAFIFSGSLTANILLGEPIITPLGNTKQLIVASMMWFAIFYSPHDFWYGAATVYPVRFLASVLNEIYRVRKISNGILQAAKFYPNSWLIMMAIGTIRGNGSGLMKLLIQLMRNPQTTKDKTFMQLSFPTKISIVAAFLLIFAKKNPWIGSFEVLYLCITIFFVGVKVSALLGISTPQYLLLENYFCAKVFRNEMDNKTEDQKQRIEKQKKVDGSKKNE